MIRNFAIGVSFVATLLIISVALVSAQAPPPPLCNDEIIDPENYVPCAPVAQACDEEGPVAWEDCQTSITTLVDDNDPTQGTTCKQLNPGFGGITNWACVFDVIRCQPNDPPTGCDVIANCVVDTYDPPGSGGPKQPCWELRACEWDADAMKCAETSRACYVVYSYIVTDADPCTLDKPCSIANKNVPSARSNRMTVMSW